MLSSKFKDKIVEFKKEFTRTKDSFDRSVDLDVLKTIHELGKPDKLSSTQSTDFGTAQQFQLQRLRPTEALFQTGEDRICLEGKIGRAHV